jgi:serine/threonine protein phosphatase PrpC
MNANSTFWIGHDHIVCQDYAIAGATCNGNIEYAIVCDGCSSSPDVDVGARLLAFSARESILTGNLTEYGLSGIEVIKRASQLFLTFPHTHSQSLDVTLLAAWVKNSKLTAYMFGDGVLIHKSKNVTRSYHIQLTSGAPDYLSYHLDNTRLKAYDKMKDNEKIITSIVSDGTGSTPFKDYGVPLLPYIVESPVETGDVIVLISDGINSFRKSDFTVIPWSDLIEEFAGFKNFEGEFVQRRIAAFKRKCIKEGVTHSDDISAAAIIV